MFDAEPIRFLTDLRGNNNRDWFTENRADSDTYVAESTKPWRRI